MSLSIQGPIMTRPQAPRKPLARESAKPSMGGIQPDMLVRFGAAEKAKPAAEVVADIKKALAGQPGEKAMTGLLDEWVNGIPWNPDFAAIERYHGAEQAAKSRERFKTNPWSLAPGAKDEALLNYVGERLGQLIRCNEAPPQTVEIAMKAGLQELFDQTLERVVVPETQAKGGFISTASPDYNPNHFELYHVGQFGSDKLIPFLEKFIKPDDLEQTGRVINALKGMTHHQDPEVSKNASRALAKLSALETAVHLKTLDEHPMASTPMLWLGQSGEGPEAAKAFPKAWDQSLDYVKNTTRKHIEGMSEKDLAREQRETQEYILTSWMGALERGLPGVAESITPRKEQIKAVLDESKKNEHDFDIRMTPSEKSDHLRAGLLGESLADLPSTTPPEGYDDHNGRSPWPYSNKDLNYYGNFIKITQCMANRGVEGAEALNKQLRAELDDYYNNTLKELLEGIPDKKPSYFYSDYSARKFLETVGHYASPKVIPMLKRVLDEPWHPSIKWSSWSNGNEQYTKDATVMAKNSVVTGLKHIIAQIELRAEIKEAKAAKAAAEKPANPITVLVEKVTGWLKKLLP